MSWSIGFGLAVLIAVASVGHGQATVEGKRAIVDWALPEPPEVVYHVSQTLTIALEATILPTGQVSDSTMVKSPWDRSGLDTDALAAVKRRYNECVQKWHFEPHSESSVVTIEFRYIPLPRGTPADQFGVLIKDETIFEIRYETIVPFNVHGTNPPFSGRMKSNCGA